jgi:multidrug efflux system membrane fusion protein
VLKEDSTVELRPIAALRTQGGETIVAKGLKPGEQVVTDGQPRLTTGAKVEVRAERQGGPGRGAEGGRPAPADPGRPTEQGRPGRSGRPAESGQKQQ